MTNQTTNSLAGRQRRYTVSRLLELAPQSRPAHFDLSKFTYDAARAGVVPPLGACVMSTRRTSSDRPRGWSQESSSSQEEIILYRGNRIVNLPERQPTVPPSERSAQENEGFARFLKKHSSPTHQRVTAGGRIVPMEQRSRPPLFSLPRAGQGTEADSKKNTRDEVNGFNKPSATALSEVKEPVSDDNISQTQPQSQPYVPGNVGVADASGTTAASNFNILPTSNVFAFDGVHPQPNYLQAVTSPPYYAPVPGDAYLLQNPQLYAGGAMSLTGFSTPFGLAFPMSYVPSPQILGLPPSCGIPTTPTDPQPREDGYIRHMLSESTANFEEYDRQLKAIDRHRAMTELDPYIREQRMKIVQLRGEAHRLMTYWSQQLGPDHKGSAKTSTYQPISTLNVKAATYVPLITHPSPEILPSGIGSAPGPQTMQFEAEKPKFDVRSTRRPIPIVPPPEDSPSPKKDAENRAGLNAESIEVDEWGLRVGPPPPEIQRQQSQMLEILVRESSISPMGSSENALIVTPGPSSDSISPREHAVENQKVQGMPEFSSESEEWLPTKPGRAPPTVEACYEVQLDAMRLPLGVISKVRMPDGTITEVRGRGLQRPPSFEMDDFEKSYWTKKPTVTKEMWDNFVEVRSCGDVSSTIDTIESKPLCFESDESQMKENARERLLRQSPQSPIEKSNDYRLVARYSNNIPNFLPGFVRKGDRSTVEPSTGSEPCLSMLKQSSASSPSIWLRGEDRNGWASNEHSRNGRVTGSEALNNNKGFSSVSIQNVHAMGRLPHLFDGASDNQRLSAKSMLSAASKTAIPYLPPGAVTSSQGFYESYPGEARGMTVESED
ncbi:hypothetical protein AYL99_08058 [Fonsecaea erecta]|uniref:Uncharacterized protein n=1 Tax=Fonsecaea erecta TaxID=1367422 RepID=A0A178ZC06_9EURO|nr:hypothetical protein AYL99_08058 [Fonsecaea erecta]OAP57320.1 hypothetical protein AYL99_08058 [Fonsecaea erecta]